MNNNYFKSNSHISRHGFESLINLSASEMHRLEMAEHLSFCDECIEKYTSLLTQDVLIESNLRVKQSVMKKIHGKIYKALINKYTIYISAACIALMLWGSGILGDITQITSGINEYLAQNNTKQYQQRYNELQNDTEQRQPILQTAAQTFESTLFNIFKTQ